MKKILLTIGCAMALLIGVPATLLAESAEVTLSGTGCCAKCKLKQTDTCQNALKSGDTLYLLEHNAVSKAFHKNLCSGTADITAIGAIKDVDGKKVLVASKISLAGEKAKSVAPKKAADGQKFVGKGVCTKCISKITAECQNGVIVKGVLHFIDHNDVSKAYHDKVCQKSTPTVVYGKLTEVAGVKKITATKIEQAPKKQAAAQPSKEKVPASLTIKGTGSCLKCALKKSDTCQNAITTTVNGKEKLYVFAKNECSNGFHKNLCSTQAEIVAVGTLAEGDQAVFTPTSLKLQEKKTLTGEALCLKCELKQARKCQNAIRVSLDGKEMIYALDQNKVSRGFHSKVCQSTVKVIAEGTVAEINGKLEFTASKIEAK